MLIERLAPLAFVAVIASSVVASCGGGENGGMTATGVSRVSVTPVGASIGVSETVQLAAVARSASGAAISGVGFTFQSSNTSVASVSASGLVTGVAPGVSTISVAAGSVKANVLVTVLAPATGNTVDVNPAIEHQTIVGWEGTGSIGEVDCNQTALVNYEAPVIDRLANELGINRVRLQLRSGVESTVDQFARFRSGAINYQTWRSTWYLPENDNADPSSINAAGFQWSFFDYQVDKVVAPLRAKLQARGERLYVSVNFVDFNQGLTSKPFQQIKVPAEYAELMAAAFLHLQQKYGFVPDAVEMLLEPENTLNSATDIATSMVATSARLHTMGFDPDFIAPSTTSMANAVSFYDTMMQVPGAAAVLTELSYHRYTGVSDNALAQIALRGARDHVRTSMLEHIGSGIDDLWQDLTVANVSAWQQYSLAYCGATDDPSVDAYYVQVNQSNPASPRVNITNSSKLFRQIFLFVRAGAVRVDATTNDNSLAAVAFRNANGKYVTIVRSRNGQASFTVRGLPPGTYGINYTTSSQYNIDAPNVTVTAGGNLTTSIPGPGLITIFAR